MSFEDLSLIEPIKKALAAEGYTKPTPIQEKAIPIVLDRRDLLGCAQTGTGKTAAFAIPIIQLLYKDKEQNTATKGIKTLILTPTRELAIQIGESFAAYGKHAGLKHVVVFGGVKQKAQTDALLAQPDILIATPGRLLDLMNQRFISLQHIKIFVLDEADRMLDMGFIHDVKKVLTKLPDERQTLFFSATMPPEIVKLSSTILSNPAKVEVTPVSSTANTIQQQVFFVDKANKKHLLSYLLEDKRIETVLVFTRTKFGANKVVKDLVSQGITAEAIHGNKSQNARQNALSNFKERKTRVLVATDIAARGIDIDELAFVINYELPNVPETYVHRIGRTGRAGASGIAISFCDAEERAYLRDIQKLIGKQIPVVTEQPYPLGDNVQASSKPAEREERSFGQRRSSGSGNRNNSSGSSRNSGANGNSRSSNSYSGNGRSTGSTDSSRRNSASSEGGNSRSNSSSSASGNREFSGRSNSSAPSTSGRSTQPRRRWSDNSGSDSTGNY